MTHETSRQEPTFGYLSTVHSLEHGYFGGYLVISSMGRPLEFHCTAPVRPNRAQQILYGPTLQPYLLGEQIGQALLVQAELTPQLILTDQEATLSLRLKTATPFVQILSSVGDPHHASAHSMAPIAHAEASNCATPLHDSEGRLANSGYEIQLPPGFEADREHVIELLATLAQRVDLAEPFERIHEAICEAQRIGGRGQDAHGQAA